MFRKTFIYCIVLAASIAWAYLNCRLESHKYIAFSNAKVHVVTGIVENMPVFQNHHSSFNFKIITIDLNPDDGIIKVNWYGKSPYLHPGETWKLYLRLKHADDLPIHDGFDYGKWLLFHDIQGLGSVDNKSPNIKIDGYHGHNIIYAMDQWRQHIYSEIRYSLKNTPYYPEAALIGGLTVGIRTDITRSQWSDFQGTGTVHLMAIAGLHMGFLAGFVFVMVNWLWSRSQGWVLRVPSQKVALVAALLAAFIYAMMAGFALPTQRAFIMIAVYTLANLSGRNTGAGKSACMAFILILLWDPLALVSASFWLSFGAVGCIFYGLHGRINPHGNLWSRYGQIQWILTVGLMPLTIWFFQYASIPGMLANIISIPIVGFFAIPLSVIACISAGLNHTVSRALLVVVAFVLDWLMRLLHFLANLPHAVWHFSFNGFIPFIASVLAVLLILAPRGMRVQWLGLVLSIALFFS